MSFYVAIDAKNPRDNCEYPINILGLA